MPNIFSVSRETFTGMECQVRPETYSSFRFARPLSLLKFGRVHSDGDEIDTGQAEVTIRQPCHFPQRRAGTVETDAAAHSQHPFGDGAIRSRMLML